MKKPSSFSQLEEAQKRMLTIQQQFAQLGLDEHQQRLLGVLHQEYQVLEESIPGIRDQQFHDEVYAFLLHGGMNTEDAPALATFLRRFAKRITRQVLECSQRATSVEEIVDSIPPIL